MNSEKTKIFVVDDDECTRRSLADTLKRNGFDVETYCCPKAFLESYDPKSKGCLLLDQAMPQMTGLELQRELVARGINLPTIFMTGLIDKDDSNEARKMGAIDYLEKPVKQELLFTLISGVFDP